MKLANKENKVYHRENVDHYKISPPRDSSGIFLGVFIFLAIIAQIIDIVAGFNNLYIHFVVYTLLGIEGLVFGNIIKIPQWDKVTKLFLAQMLLPILLLFKSFISSFSDQIPWVGFISAFVTFFPVLIIFGPLWDTKFIGFLLKIYVVGFGFIILFQYLLLPAFNTSIPGIGDITTTDYNPAHAWNYMYEFVVGGYTGTTKYFADLIYYAQHGEYPGETAKSDIPNIMEFGDPITPNKLDYANGEPVVVSAFFASSNTNTIKVFFSCYHTKSSCRSNCEPTRDTNVEPSYAKDRYIAETVFCTPKLEQLESGANKITLFAKGMDLNTTATLTNYFTSQEGMRTQLNRYYSKIENSELATGIIDTMEKRNTALRDIYNVNKEIISVSDPGNIKLILYTKTDPVIGINTEEKDSTLSLVAVFENVAEGQIDAINSLTVKLPAGMTPAQGKCTDFEFDNKNIISAKKMDPEIIATRLNFTKQPQVALLPCVLEIKNPDAVLANGPNLATPQTFIGTISYNYTVKKEFNIKYGEEQKGDVGVSGTGQACPAIDSISGYSDNKGRAEACEVKVNEYNYYITKYATKWGVCSALVKSVMAAESCGKSDAISGAGAKGLMQLMPKTAKGSCNLEESAIFDPEKNIECGTRYLKAQLEKFNGDIVKAVAAYNSGAGAVEQYGGVPPFPETQLYVGDVIGGAKYYSAKTATIAAGSGQCTGDLVNIGTSHSGKTLYLRKSAADQWTATKQKLDQQNIHYVINSAYRTPEEQAAQDTALACGKEDDNYAHCPHVQGCALDIDSAGSTTQDQLRQAMFGANWVGISSESWHFEYGTNGWLAARSEGKTVYA